MSSNITQIFHVFLFNIGNYSPDLGDIQRREAEFNIIFPRVNNFGINIKHILNKNRHGIFVLLYTPSTKQNIEWILTRQNKFKWQHNFF